MSARDEAAIKRLTRRWLTLGGNLVGVPIALAATSHAITFATPEFDAQYGVLVTPNWNTTCWVTSPTTTGCTLNFGTGAPANATCGVVVFREEV